MKLQIQKIFDKNVNNMETDDLVHLTCQILENTRIIELRDAISYLLRPQEHLPFHIDVDEEKITSISSMLEKKGGMTTEISNQIKQQVEY